MAGLHFSRSKGYFLCIGVIALATLVRWLLNPVLKTDLPYIADYFAIMLIAWLGGLGPAVLGVILGIVSTDYLLMAPQNAWSTATGMHNLLSTLLLAFIGVATGSMSEIYGRTLAESKQANRLSQNRQLELEHIYSSAPVGLALIDDNLRYLRVNETLARFNGVQASNHIGKHISEVLPPQIADMLGPLLHRVLATRTPLTSVELAGPAARGSSVMRYVKVSLYPLLLGSVYGVHAVVEDITAEKKVHDELKSLEQQLQHAVKMEAIGRLAGGVAHDFNNLFMVISSYTELLLEQLKADAGAVRKLNAIGCATERAARFTRQLLAFSRKQTLQTQVLELDPLVSASEPLLRRLLQEDIELILELDSRKAQVKVDPVQFEQVLTNLTLNSRDAMRSGGRLVIHTRSRGYDEASVRSLFSLPAGKYVEMSITDSGPGMSPEVQARIFDPFFTTKEPGQGAGLGLAVVYGIIKQSGGYIEVNSDVGQGTTFRLWFPIVHERRESMQELPSGLRIGATILLVEDEALLRRAISESLSALGYRVLEAPNGARALEVIKQEAGSIALVLSDAVMPQMGGADLIRQARERCHGLKAILMSGCTQARSTGSNANDKIDPDIEFLQKPFAHAELAKIIRKLLSNSLRT